MGRSAHRSKGFKWYRNVLTAGSYGSLLLGRGRNRLLPIATSFDKKMAYAILNLGSDVEIPSKRWGPQYSDKSDNWPTWASLAKLLSGTEPKSVGIYRESSGIWSSSISLREIRLELRRPTACKSFFQPGEILRTQCQRSRTGPRKEAASEDMPKKQGRLRIRPADMFSLRKLRY